MCYHYGCLPFKGGLLDQPSVWIGKLAKWLPYHQDQAIVRLANAINGQFTPSFTEEGHKARTSRLEGRTAPLMRRLKERLGR